MRITVQYTNKEQNAKEQNVTLWIWILVQLKPKQKLRFIDTSDDLCHETMSCMVVRFQKTKDMQTETAQVSVFREISKIFYFYFFF